MEEVRVKLSRSLEENMKRKFILGSHHSGCVCHAMFQQYSMLSLTGLNLNSIAVQLCKRRALLNASRKFPILYGLENKSLLQICEESHDRDIAKVLLQRMMEEDSYVNMETMCIIIKSPFNETTQKYLSQC